MNRTSPTPETGKPNLRDAEAEATRRELIWAALDILAREGERGVTMVAVANQAKRSRGTVYHHFADREDLLRCVREDLALQLSEISSGRRRPADPFAFPVETARNAPEIVRLESLNMLREGKANPHVAGLISRLKDTAASATVPLHADVDVEAAATLLVVCSWIAADVYMADAKGEEARRTAAERFAQTLRHFVFHGLLDEERHQRFVEAIAAGAASAAP